MELKLDGRAISVNSLYRGRRFLTNEGKAIKQSYFYDIKKQYKGKIITGDVEVYLDLIFSDKRRRDIDGPIKAILDSLTGIVLKDDSQIQTLIVNKRVDKEVKPYSLVTVIEL